MAEYLCYYFDNEANGFEQVAHIHKILQEFFDMPIIALPYESSLRMINTKKLVNIRDVINDMLSNRTDYHE